MTESRNSPIEKAPLLFPDETNEDVWRYLVKEAWANGELSYKFKKVQYEMYRDIQDMHGFKYVVKCSRRLGKTFFLCALSVEACLKKPFAMVRYAAPTHKALKKFILPVMRRIMEDCPEELRPEFVKSDGVFKFKNGSEIHLSGVNNENADNLRGTHADLFIIDEAGTVDDLTYVINDIAMPQFLDPNHKIIEGRKLIISGTPARTPAHEFAGVCREADARGNISHYDIYRAEYPQLAIDMIIEECGGVDSTTWKREYLALDVVDSNYALIPEWSSTYAMPPVVDDKFVFYHKYVGLDIGVRDLTVALFAHYDFLRATLYVHDEVVLSGPQMTTERLAHLVKLKESELFLGDNKAYKRVSDIDLLLLNDLRALHSLYFRPTDKGKLEEMVNEVRIWVNAGRVIVDPKCKQLLGCLAYGVWNENRTDFDRTPEYGHFDGLAALMYLIRNIDANVNPIPITHNRPSEDTWYEDDIRKSQRNEKLKSAFSGRKR